MKRNPVQVELTSKQKKKLQRLAKNSRTTMSNVVRSLIDSASDTGFYSRSS